jgi:hypothetical protein
VERNTKLGIEWGRVREGLSIAEQVERLRCISDGMGDLYSNDEILAVGVGYGVPGALTVEQMAREADEALADLLEGAVV